MRRERVSLLPSPRPGFVLIVAEEAGSCCNASCPCPCSQEYRRRVLPPPWKVSLRRRFLALGDRVVPLQPRQGPRVVLAQRALPLGVGMALPFALGLWRAGL